MHQSLPIEPILRTSTKFCRFVRDDRRRRLLKERGMTKRKLLMILAVIGVFAGFLFGPRVVQLVHPSTQPAAHPEGSPSRSASPSDGDLSSGK